MKNDDIFEIIQSSGNVFADLGIKSAEQHLAKAKLAHQISKIIEERRITQVQAAKLLGVDQPKISALIRGRISGFSMDRLFQYLIILGQDIEIRIKPHKHTNEKASDQLHLNIRCV